jgi:hypothetical protein
MSTLTMGLPVRWRPVIFRRSLETLHDHLALRTIGHFAVLQSEAAGKIGPCRVFDAQHGHNTAAAADR